MVMPAGCGKTALVSELARLTGNADLLSVHVDDQMDAKSVVGAYVTTAVPGEFAWAAGPLTQVLPYMRVMCMPGNGICLITVPMGSCCPWQTPGHTDGAAQKI